MSRLAASIFKSGFSLELERDAMRSLRRFEDNSTLSWEDTALNYFAATISRCLNRVLFVNYIPEW